LLDCKRKSDPMMDEVEDGGRAAVIEEGVSALVYAYARTRDFLDGATEVDHDIIDMVRKMTSHLEVRARTDAEWGKAILVGFNVWRQVRKDNGGRVTVDLEKRDLFYASTPTQKKTAVAKVTKPRKARKPRTAPAVPNAKRSSVRLGRAANDD
jgi:hypothetical protein